MTDRTVRFGHLTRTARVAAAACSLALLAACGGGGDDTAEMKTPAELLADLQGEDQDDADNDRSDAGDGASEDGASGDGASEDGAERTGTIAFKLPNSTETPDGFTTIDDECATEDRGGVVTYAVPDDWDNTGFGMAGSGGGLEGSIDHRFTIPEGEVIIDIAGDNRDEEGRILNGAREPDESFDYDYTIGDDTTEVKFTSVMTVALEYQDVEVFSADEATYPEVIDGEEFRVRFDAFDAEWPANTMTQSAVMTISAPTGAVDEETLEAIVASMQLPECAQNAIIVGQEMISSTDLDGDGHVSDGDDFQNLPNNQ